VAWLRVEISRREGSIAYEGTTSDLVDHALNLLSNLVTKVRNMYVPAVSAENGKQNKSILVLDYYRNQLQHLFTGEGMISCILFPSLSAKTVFKKQKIFEESQFLSDLLRLEYVNKPSPNQKEDFVIVLETLSERNILKCEEESVQIISEGPLTLYGNMFWPLIDSYWIAVLSLFSLQPNVVIKRRLLLQRVQWIAEKMHSEGKIYYYESCSLELLLNAINLFQKWKVIAYKYSSKPSTKAPKKRIMRRNKEPGEDPEVYLLSPYQQESSINELATHINKFRRSPPQYNKAKTLKRAVLSDFPVLSKL